MEVAVARLPRLTMSGVLHHVVQRGNNQQPIVRTDADRQTLLEMLAEQVRPVGVALHAYVLTDSQLHVLVTPESEKGVPALMQALGRRYVRYFNDLHHRSGTLWDGRYRSALVEAQPWLLRCMCHLDWLPVRSGLVSSPGEYLWSSHRHYVGQVQSRGLSPHSAYWGLGNTPFAREAAYEALVQQGLTELERQEIDASALHGWALGGEAFKADLQQRTPRRVSKSRPGRPPAM
jgi:putative transposase